MSATKITRAELYDLVWRTPMSRLAAEFGMSDVALAKTCDRLALPRPGRGYWAKIAVGIEVERPPLGAPADGTSEWILVERSETPSPRPPKPKAPAVVVPSDLRRAPDVIRRLGVALGTTTRDEHGRLVVGHPRDPVFAVTIARHRRALLLLAGLAVAAEQRGQALTFDDGEATLALRVGQDLLGLSLVEQLEAVEHVLTADEKRRAATGDTSRIPKHDYAVSGRLHLRLHGTRGARASWSDTTTRTLDRQLGAVILAGEAEIARRHQLHAAEEQRKSDEVRRHLAEEEERRRQRLHGARRKYETGLATDLRQMARAWSEAEEIRRFVAAFREALAVGAQTARDATWLAWADRFAMALDPLSQVGAVAKQTEPSDDELSEWERAARS